MKKSCRAPGMYSLFIAALVMLAGCDVINWKGREPGEIPFKLVGVDTGACPMIMSIGQQRWNIDYFGFYLSKPELRIDGRWQRVKFKQTQWQTPNEALLKFHNKCVNPDDANSKIVLDVSEELLMLSTNLRFTMGLPFDVNHANPSTQPSPLNDSSMVSNQRDGHMFLKLDVSKSGDATHKWSYHLGSAGCDAETESTPPESTCAFTNRVEFILPMTQLDTDLDLEVSVSNIVAQVEINEAPSCVFASSEITPCDKLIQNLVHRPWIKWQ